MKKLRVALVAFRGAGDGMFEKGRARLSQLIAPEQVEFVEQQPDVIYFLSGGSERAAAAHLQPDRWTLLLAFKEENAYAAATETLAYARQRGCAATLIDGEDAETPALLGHLAAVVDGAARLHGQRLGLIGDVSEWLIASNIDAELLKNRLGIELRQILWSALPTYAAQPPSPELLAAFHAPDKNLDDTASVYALLRQCVQAEKLDAITVECFSMVKAHAVTACLPLAKFNADGFPAGCEGDLVSIVGMMLTNAVTGIVPWLANTAQIREDRALFAHCTIAPTLLRECAVTTHFETGVGTAIQGEFAADDVTIFRLDSSLRRAFLTCAPVLARPRYAHACRTQIEVAPPPQAVRLLRDSPLGNHHLILPGNHADRLRLACLRFGLEAQK